MPTPTLLYDQLLRFLRQYSQAQDLRYLKALAAMSRTFQINVIAPIYYRTFWGQNWLAYSAA